MFRLLYKTENYLNEIKKINPETYALRIEGYYVPETIPEDILLDIVIAPYTENDDHNIHFLSHNDNAYAVFPREGYISRENREKIRDLTLKFIKWLRHENDILIEWYHYKLSDKDKESALRFMGYRKTDGTAEEYDITMKRKEKEVIYDPKNNRPNTYREL